MKGKYTRNLLQSASECGNVAIIERILSRGLDINSKESDGNTSLMIAALSGKVEAVNYLLDKGADPYLNTFFFALCLHECRTVFCTKIDSACVRYCILATH